MTVTHEPTPKQNTRKINDSLPDATKVENPVLEKSEGEGDLKDSMSNHDKT